MDRQNKILLLVLVFGIVFSVFATFNRIYIQRDFIISAEIDCDPEINSCFVWEEEDGEIWYYNIIEKKASNIPNCNPHREDCDDPFYCEAGEEDCEEFFCDAEELEEGEFCAGPGLVLEY